MLEGMNSSISRRRALRILGAGVALALPFTSFVGSASAEGGVTRFDTPHTLMAVVSDTPLWADSAGSLPVGIAPAAALFEPLGAIGQLVQARDASSGATSSWIAPSSIRRRRKAPWPCRAAGGAEWWSMGRTSDPLPAVGR
jgi:hypothetical protein